MIGGNKLNKLRFYFKVTGGFISVVDSFSHITIKHLNLNEEDERSRKAIKDCIVSLINMDYDKYLLMLNDLKLFRFDNKGNLLLSMDYNEEEKWLNSAWSFETEKLLKKLDITIEIPRDCKEFKQGTIKDIKSSLSPTKVGSSKDILESKESKANIRPKKAKKKLKVSNNMDTLYEEEKSITKDSMPIKKTKDKPSISKLSKKSKIHKINKDININAKEEDNNKIKKKLPSANRKKLKKK